MKPGHLLCVLWKILTVEVAIILTYKRKRPAMRGVFYCIGLQMVFQLQSFFGISKIAHGETVDASVAFLNQMTFLCLEILMVVCQA
jgi:hypothetical protein